MTHMTIFQATQIAENPAMGSHDDWLEAFQLLIDTGVVWQLQGWFGRTALDLIESGQCHLPEGEMLV